MKNNSSDEAGGLTSAVNANLQHDHQPKLDREGTTETTEFYIKLLSKSLIYTKLFILAKDPFEVGEKITNIHVPRCNLSYLRYLRSYEKFGTCYHPGCKGKNAYESY